MKKELIVQRTPKSPIAEVFRTLRTNIQFMNSKKDLKSILITSTMPSEGKSWIAANLAISFAQAGEKVILIDADMRKGKQHLTFNVENEKGLSNYLSGIDERGSQKVLNIERYIKPTEIQNLFLLPAGNIPPNPSELLVSENTISMIEKLRAKFDFIIFDGTPSLLVTDSLILSRLVDSTVIVAEYNLTKKDNLLRVKKAIENVGGNIAGIILNKMPVKVNSYKSSYYYSSKAPVSSRGRSLINEMNRVEFKRETKNERNEEKIRNIYEQTNNSSNGNAQKVINELNDWLKK